MSPTRERRGLQGVQLPRGSDGERSSTAVTRGVVAEALSAVDLAAGAAAGAQPDWRTGYLAHVAAMTAVGARSAPACLAVARTGLDALAARMVFVRNGSERPVAAALREAQEPALGTATVRGQGKRQRDLVVPYRGEQLRGDGLRRQLDAWVAAGRVEASCAAAVQRVLACPDWLDLSDRAVAVLGAGAEMGPLERLLSWGATVLAVDVPSDRLWQRLLATARAGAGTLHAPLGSGAAGAEQAGADMLVQTPELADWLVRTAPDLPLTVGSYAYADGSAHLRLACAADAIVVELLQRRGEVSYAELATPTDAFVVPLEVVAESRRRWSARGMRGLVQQPARTLSRGSLFAPAYPTTLRADDGREVGVADSLVPQQGPNYALAKRVQRWRALVGRADGVLVSANVAPATRTHSVLRNRVLAAAYAGAHRFDVEVFEPATSRALMAALLVHDLRETTAAGCPSSPSRHPDELLAEGAAHGGLWRIPYAPRSVLALAALAGAPGLLRR